MGKVYQLLTLMSDMVLVYEMAEIDEQKELDRNIPLTIHLVIGLVRSLGNMVKDYPIASGFIALTQLFTVGVEINQTLHGNPPPLEQVELNHSFMLAFVGVPGGMVLEGGIRLVRAVAGIERRWKDGTISSDPSLAELFDRGD